MESIAILLGTRPEIIKMTPIINELKRKKRQFYIIHSGQHYSYNLDKIFFEQLNLPQPKYKLNVGSDSPGKQTADIILGVERIIQKDKPEILLVQGDTNTVLGGSIAARKCNVKLGHVEAGLRSYDETMPEEHNRVVSDHVSDYLFTPTKQSRENLLKEMIDRKKIFVTGNTIVDAVNDNYQRIKDKKIILDKFGLKYGQFFLVSIHRQENVDNPKRYKDIINGINLVQRKYNIPVIYPVHPRSKKMAEKFKISFGKINTYEPIDYLTFLLLEKNAKLIMTDSGGVQEEACILKTPCVTLRDNTERPETIKVGANIISGTKPKRILSCVDSMINKKRSWKNPFGNGNSAERIIKVLERP